MLSAFITYSAISAHYEIKLIYATMSFMVYSKDPSEESTLQNYSESLKNFPTFFSVEDISMLAAVIN